MYFSYWEFQPLEIHVASTFRRDYCLAESNMDPLPRNSELRRRAVLCYECVKRYGTETLRNTLRQDRAYGPASITRKSV